MSFTFPSSFSPPKPQPRFSADSPQLWLEAGSHRIRQSSNQVHKSAATVIQLLLVAEKIHLQFLADFSSISHTSRSMLVKTELLTGWGWWAEIHSSRPPPPQLHESATTATQLLPAAEKHRHGPQGYIHPKFSHLQGPTHETELLAG
jgi:nicotinate-nucleotide pyrophosphorylase